VNVLKDLNGSLLTIGKIFSRLDSQFITEKTHHRVYTSKSQNQILNSHRTYHRDVSNSNQNPINEISSCINWLSVNLEICYVRSDILSNISCIFWESEDINNLLESLGH